MSHPDAQGLRWRGTFVGCLSLILLAVVAVTIWMWWETHREGPEIIIGRLIQEELGADADRPAVEAWFDRHGIQHWYIADTASRRLNGQTPATIAGLRDEDLSGIVHGHTGRRPEFGFRHSGTIDIYFFLDKHGKVVGHLVDPFVYSL